MRLILGLVIALAPLAASAGIIGDPSFETVSVGGSYAYRPSGSAWKFASDSGLTAQNVFFAGPAPDGTQAAFIQSAASGQGNITQTLTGLTQGDTYTFSFYAAQRSGGYAADPIDVSFAEQDLGTFTPTSLSFALFTTQSFVATERSGQLSFLGAPSQGDNDSVIDLVTISGQAPVVTGVPEPATVGLLGAGLLGIGMVGRRRR